MRTMEQTQGQSIIKHGLLVWSYSRNLILSKTDEFVLPQWWEQYKQSTHLNLHSYKTIKSYTIWHDIGKIDCLEIDNEGKRHFPNHAQKSKEIWDTNFPDRKDVSRLIEYDMVFHTMSAEDILGLDLSDKDLCTLLIVSLAELHANAWTFYPDEGTSSTWFKIKFKKWSKTAQKICDKIFNHSYMYVLVRKDLSPRQQAVQSCHAAIEAARNYIGPKDEHPSVIICSVKSEQKLAMCMEELTSKGIECQSFREPDIGNQLTAIASRPLKGEERKAFSRFQLMQ